MVTVRKLNQDGRIYYYLEHPVKVDGKVKKRARYLGKEIPENLEELKRQFLLDILNSRFAEVSRRARIIEEESTRGMNPEELKERNHRIAIDLTTSSLGIEGSRVTALELTRLVKNDRVPKSRSSEEIQETLAHYRILFDILDKKPVFSFENLVDWHWKLFRVSHPDLAGLVRDTMNGDGDLFPPTNRKKGEQCVIRTLASWYDDVYVYMDRVMLAGLAHFRLSSHSPFHLGNNIIARLSMFTILHSGGFPAFSIEFKERKRYEIALSSSGKGDNYLPFLKWYLLNYGRKILSLNRRN